MLCTIYFNRLGKNDETRNDCDPCRFINLIRPLNLLLYPFIKPLLTPLMILSTVLTLFDLESGR